MAGLGAVGRAFRMWARWLGQAQTGPWRYGRQHRIDAGKANASDFVRKRALSCKAQRECPVNFVAVDFANLGDAAGAVAALSERRVG